APGLAAVAVDGYGATPERLHDEVGHDPAVVDGHAGPVRVEDPRHLDPDAMLAVIVEEQGLRRPLPLVVAAARADGAHVAPVVLELGMDAGDPVHLARARLQDLRLHALGEPEHVDGAGHAR